MDDWENESGQSFVCEQPNQDTKFQKVSVDNNRNIETSSNFSKIDNLTTMTVLSRECGKIIGKGGSTIKNIQTKTGARVNISKEKEFGGKVPVKISGEVHERKAAENMILELLGNFEDTSDVSTNSKEKTSNDFSYGRSNDNVSKTLMVESQNCGKIIGKGGSKIRELQNNSGANISIDRNNLDGNKVPVTITGSDDAILKAENAIHDLLSSWGNSYPQSNREYSSGDNNFNKRDSFNDKTNDSFNTGNSSSFTSYNRINNETTERKTIMVESCDCGRIIGKGGSKIRELQDDSGATIKVERNSCGDQVPVIISGSLDAIKKAESAIKELTMSYGNNFNNVRENATDTSSQNENYTSGGFLNWSAIVKQSVEFTKKKWAQLPPLVKNFYIEDDQVASMLPSEVSAWRKENYDVSVIDLSKNNEKRKVFNPVTSFEQAFQHYPEILDTIQNQKFSKPSPIQGQLWPLALSGYDVIGIAQTGSGKTLAFLLPAFIHIDSQSIPREKRKGPTALILTPTRELALQIEVEINKYKYRSITCVCIYGGGNRKKQIDISTKGVDIIVATPGRFNDLVYNGFISLESVSYVVLDEADRMLDMGFEPQIMKVLLDIRPDRQTIMTSATWPEGVRHMGEKYLNNPMQVACGSLDLAAVHTVDQVVEVIQEEEKMERLKEFIVCMDEKEKVLVFAGRKTTVDQLSADLCMLDIDCQSIHGGREQGDREQALLDFKTSDVRILIATDVAARGIDVLDVSHVINYDCPKNMEEYVHRVGRTGRAGRSGVAITFMTRKDCGSSGELIKILEEAGQNVPEEVREMNERFIKMKERRDNERNAYSGRSGRGGRGGNRHHGSRDGFDSMSFGGSRGRGRSNKW